METLIVYWGIYWGYKGVVLGLHWDNGKEMEAIIYLMTPFGLLVA